MTTRLLIHARQFIAGHIEEVGGCDHSVNICCCTEKTLVRAIDEELVKQHGTDLPWQFYHAEPTHYGLNPTEEQVKAAVSWGQDGARAYKAVMNNIIDNHVDDITTHNEAPF